MLSRLGQTKFETNEDICILNRTSFKLLTLKYTNLE